MQPSMEDTEPLSYNDIELAMSSLQHVPDASWDVQGRKGCMVGTRINVLRDLMSWSKDRKQPPLFWLTGMAGMGKSAISVSLCEQLQATEHFGGSFFCARTSTAGDARRIIPTLAYHLARRVNGYKLALVRRLQNNPDDIHKPIGDQVERLLREPLSNLTLPGATRYVFVVDGIDECMDREAAVDLINSLIAFAPRLSLKILLTSRPEDHIRHDTPLISAEYNRILRLHELGRGEVDPDITLYFTENLKQIRRLNNAVNDTLVKRLVDLANGLFIFASTAIAYVRDGNSVQRLRLLTDLDNKFSLVSTKPLDAMYGLILEHAASPKKMEPEELDDLKDILAVVLALRSRLSISALSELLGRSPEGLRDILDHLHAVINIPDGDDDPGLNILHATFEDFLSDGQRAPSHFLIDIVSGHGNLTLGCFTIIRSHVPTDTSPYFTSPVPAVRPSPGSSALMYASLHWSHHHAQASTFSYDDETEEGMICVAEAFYTYFKLSRRVYTEYLDCAIASQQGVVGRTHKDYSKISSRLEKLGDFLISRFDRLGVIADLEAAIEAYRRADKLTANNHPHKHIRLSDIGRAMEARFKRLGDATDLEAAVEAYRLADELTPNDHPEKHIRLSDIGDATEIRFERLGNITDLEAAVEAHRRADDLTPEDHPDKHIGLGNIGRAMEARFERLGDMTDLEMAIKAYHRADNLTLDDHPDKHIRLSNIGHAMLARFKRLGDMADLEAAVEAYRRADHLTSDDHPAKRIRFRDIGRTMLARFKRLGDTTDLQAAVEAYRRADELTPDDHRDKHICLSDIGRAMLARFEQLGDMADLEAAVEACRRADDLTPDNHPAKRIRLSYIGRGMQARFDRLGDIADLEAAVKAYRRADELIPNDHPEKHIHLSDIGNAMLARFKSLKNVVDVEVAVEAYHRANELTPDNHPDKHIRLSNIRVAMQACFRELDYITHLDEAIAAPADNSGHGQEPNRVLGWARRFSGALYLIR